MCKGPEGAKEKSEALFFDSGVPAGIAVAKREGSGALGLWGPFRSSAMTSSMSSVTAAEVVFVEGCTGGSGALGAAKLLKEKGELVEGPAERLGTKPAMSGLGAAAFRRAKEPTLGGTNGFTAPLAKTSLFASLLTADFVLSGRQPALDAASSRCLSYWLSRPGRHVVR